MLRRTTMYIFIVIMFSLCFLFTVNAANDPKIYAKDNILAVGNYNVNATSSDLSFIARVEVNGKAIIDEGSELLYIVPEKNIDGWEKARFNDSGWEKGISGIGYADGDDNTVLPGWVASVYSRYRFDVQNANSTKEITFLLDYDDAYILWLNDVEVGRSDNIKAVVPDGVPGFNEPLGKIAVDHEATVLPAGKPNANRWKSAVGWGHNQLGKHVVVVSYGGNSGLSVNPIESLVTTWSYIKSKN
ncbi:TPA: hypothetical protein ENS27_06825 [bacterium]|nr:hypothetical protein [bacterium]